ncbi:MAG: FAD-binding oxidoreductase [Woeseia sp.]
MNANTILCRMLSAQSCLNSRRKCCYASDHSVLPTYLSSKGERLKPQITEPLPAYMQWESVSSLVGSRRAECLVAYPTSEAECRDTIAFCKRNELSICPRGGGYSYGDIILNHKNMILSTAKMDRILEIDERNGLMSVEPGVKIIDIFKRVLHLRFTLAASPSESTVTVAGAIGCNVNGKDSWRLGNFGDQVVALKLLTASGELLHIDRSKDEHLLRAVVGGLGLIGIIVQVKIRLQKILSPFLEISRTPVANVEQLLEYMAEVEATSDFAVVWLDTCTKGAELGRAVIHSTRWVERVGTSDELHAQVAASFARLEARLRQARMLTPITEFVVTSMLQVQKLSIPLFNKLYFFYCRLRYRLRLAENVESILRYNFDASFMIPSAAAVCGPRGYTIQVIFPRSDAQTAITEMIKLCQASPCLPAKLIMRVHRGDDYLISFSEDGYSLNFELHPKKRHVARMQKFVNNLIASVIRFGGKVHLAKDMVLTREQFRGLFPGYRDFLAVKRRLDPDELFQSDMYRRLIRRNAEDLASSVNSSGQAR